MKTSSRTTPGFRMDLSINTTGSRVCWRARPSIIRLLVAMTVAAPCGTLLAVGAQPLDLGAAAGFGVLAGGAITGTGDVEGDVGSGGGAIAPVITSTGTIYPSGHATVMAALADFDTAYHEGMNSAHDVLLSAAAYDLGGTTLTPGVYKIGAAATLTSPVILDGAGDPDAVFIIQVVGALGATAGVGNVIVTNAAHSANIFWIVEGAVSMGAGTHMSGTILCGAAVTFGATTTLEGRALAGAAAGAIGLATTVSAPVVPSVVGDRVWFDANGDGLQDPAETTGFPNVPVALLQVNLERLTIELGAAAHFGALAGGAVSGTGHVVADVGSGTGAIAPAITSDGTIHPTGHATTLTALADFAAAYNDARHRAPDVLLSAAAFDLGGATLTPGVNKIGAAGTLTSPVTLDGAGDPDAVFIIQVAGALGATAGVGNVILTNAVQSANVFWVVEGAVSMGAGTQMEGTVLCGAAITFGAGATISGRALAGSAAGTITLAATVVSETTGTPPVGFPPPMVVADTVTDANGHYLFEGVPPGTFIVRWDLSGLTADHRITHAKQGSDDMLDSDGATGDVGGFVHSMEWVVLSGTTLLGVDLGLVETLPAIKVAALDELAAALAAYLDANYYTYENWNALKAARTEGDLAINDAADPAGVSLALAAALAAMDAVPAFSDRPMFTEITPSAEGGVLLVLRTTPDILLTLETSTDLQNWTPIATATPDTVSWSWFDATALGTEQRRFYRAYISPKFDINRPEDARESSLFDRSRSLPGRQSLRHTIAARISSKGRVAKVVAESDMA